MKKELQVKFLNFLNTRKNNEEGGFTLIELLVVIIIIGILAAIALPSLLGQANKAKQSEARQNVGSVMRGNQAYYLENAGFTTVLVSMGLGIETSTTNYSYVIKQNAASSAVTPPADKWNAVGVNGIPAAGSLKWYFGHMQTGISGTGTQATESTTLATLCESVSPMTAGVQAPQALNAALAPAQQGSQFLDCANANVPAPPTQSTPNNWKDLGS